VTHTADARTQPLPPVRAASGAGGLGLEDEPASVPMHVLEATRAGLVGLDDHTPRQLTGTAPPVLSLGF